MCEADNSTTRIFNVLGSTVCTNLMSIHTTAAFKRLKKGKKSANNNLCLNLLIIATAKSLN